MTRRYYVVVDKDGSPGEIYVRVPPDECMIEGETLVEVSPTAETRREVMEEVRAVLEDESEYWKGMVGEFRDHRCGAIIALGNLKQALAKLDGGKEGK